MTSNRYGTPAKSSIIKLEGEDFYENALNWNLRSGRVMGDLPGTASDASNAYQQHSTPGSTEFFDD
jgi:hypothetical protein